jgi:ABC transport system ATP-binding/permease protein
LIRLLLGDLEPTEGSVWRGTKLEVAYYDQQRAQLDLDASVMENVGTQGEYVRVNGENRHVSGYLQDFLFRPEQLKTPAGALSGGERNRLLLARLFAQPANLLVLDEPTNDLDIDTLELLQELVAEFAGTLLLVSHDREFLDNVVTNLLVLEGDGNVLDFVGGYGEYEAWRDARSKAPARPAAPPPAPAPSSAPAAAPVAKAAAKRRRSYNEQRELDALPGQIEALEKEIRALEKEVGSPKFYQRPWHETVPVVDGLKAKQAEHDKLTARWLELEELKNRLASSAAG